jgi:hypothetical protein
MVRKSRVLSDIPRDRQTRLLSIKQSFVRVAAENQHAKIEPFQAWAVDTGQWGGRELTPEDPDSSKSSPTIIWEFAPKRYPKISSLILRYPKISLNSNKSKDKFYGYERISLTG